MLEAITRNTRMNMTQVYLIHSSDSGNTTKPSHPLWTDLLRVAYTCITAHLQNKTRSASD